MEPRHRRLVVTGAMAAAALILFFGCCYTPTLPAVFIHESPLPVCTVAELAGDPSSPGRLVQVDAYYGKYIPRHAIPHTIPRHAIPHPRPAGEQDCPEWDAFIADEPPATCQPLGDDYTCSGPLEPSPSLYVVLPSHWLDFLLERQDPPSLPYHARFIGHLSDPAVAHCTGPEQLFTIDWIAQVYEQKLPITGP